MLRVSVSRGSRKRSGSGIGTWKTRIWPSVSGVSGMRWRVWMMVASAVAVVVATPAVLAKNLRIETALVVSSEPWSMTLSTSSGPMNGGGDLHAAGAPAIGHRHLAGGERHLVAGNGDRLQDGAADHPLGLLVEIGEVVAGGWARSFRSLLPALGRRRPRCAARAPRRSWRIKPSSAWKST